MFKAFRQESDAHEAFNKYQELILPEIAGKREDFIKQGQKTVKEFEGVKFKLVKSKEGVMTAMAVKEEKDAR